MNNHRVNKIIAEYLCGDRFEYTVNSTDIDVYDNLIEGFVGLPINLFTDSVNSLFPVWDKLKKDYTHFRVKFEVYPNVGIDVSMKLKNKWIHSEQLFSDMSASEAAAELTAKAIELLTK